MKLKDYKENPYIWPGGYRIDAVMDDGELLCHTCATKEEEVHEGGDADGWRFEGTTIHWEGPPEYCAHCNQSLNSVYGNPDDED